MKLNMYSIHDQKAKAFMQPFFMSTDGQAIRAFTDNINSSESSMITAHPEDFTLYLLGTFDDQNGLLEGDVPVSLGNGKTFQLDNYEPPAGITSQLEKLDASLQELASKIL